MYIRVMSKQLAREIEGYQLLAPYDATLYVPDSIRTCDNPQYEAYATGITVFTDGSVFSGPVGYGACAAVLFPSVHSEEKIVQTCAVGKKVTSFQCEVEVIVLGIKMVTNYFGNLAPRLNLESVHIMCDSSMAIETVDKCKISV